MDLLESSPAPGRRASSISMGTDNEDTLLELTPRSKIQAMLAALDDDSDKENPKAFQTKRLVPSSTVTRSAPLESSSEEDSDVPQARRGTLAARMRERVTSTEIEGGLGHEGKSPARANERLQHGIEKLPARSARSLSPPTADNPALTSPTSRPSPGLFVSPEHRLPVIDHSSSPSKIPNRLQALAARKRQELLAKEPQREESEEEAIEEVTPSPSKPRKKKAIQHKLVVGESESDGDAEVNRKFTQQARPTRKASKRALEEMHRETQRLSRNMQLTHEARTKIKFTTEALFAKFNFRQIKPVIIEEVQVHQPTRSSSATASSDAEAHLANETPPSSPPSQGDNSAKKLPDSFHLPRLTAQADSADASFSDGSEHLLDLNNITSQRQANSRARVKPASRHITPAQADNGIPPKRASVRRFAKSVSKTPMLAQSDDELEILKPQTASRLPIFNDMPAAKAKGSHSFHALRALAHLNDSDRLRKQSKSSMTPSELQSILHRRAREQAICERDEKIQRLREKGVIVQTAEEKEKEQMQLESMLERARKDAEELAKKEKEAAKREGKEDPNMPDSDDDEDYKASDEEEEIEDLSGSEDEGTQDLEAGPELGEEEGHGENSGEDELVHDDEAQQEEPLNEFFEDEAGEEEEEEEDVVVDDEDFKTGPSQAAQSLPSARRPTRRKIVDSDDEAESLDKPLAQTQQQSIPIPVTPATTKMFGFPTSDAFGFVNAQPAALDLSQVFAGTMAEEQSQDKSITEGPFDSQQDSMAFLRGLPDPDLPNYEDSLAVDSPVAPALMIQDSQKTQTPGRCSQTAGLVNFDAQTQLDSAATQFSDLPEPTQDAGFHVLDSQPAAVDASHITVDTVLLDNELQQSPPLKRARGRLHRRVTRADNTVPAVSDEGFEATIASGSEEDEDAAPVDAFTRMREVRAKAAQAEAFNKKQSDAKRMVEEQAEESEDEYAGLGGASDDESQGELDEETKKMIDDHGNEVTNERDIAAYYAEKERLEDEKGIEKLYKDVINGGLRRKRGAEHDLFDSDDEDEAAARRRAAKQREFAKMRKALLADEKIGKIAANPKQAAFLQAIEDHDDDDELDFLDRPEESFTIAIPDSQGDNARSQPLSSVSTNTAGPKRKLSATTAENPQQGEDAALPANPRRSKVARMTRPTSLADIRNTLSEIIGEPESILESQNTDSEGSDDERGGNRITDETGGDDDLYTRPDDMPHPESRSINPRRTRATSTRTSVIDRMALKKQASSSLSTHSAADGRLAFHDAASTSSFTFKVPSLLRRATTNNSVDSNAAPANNGRSSVTGGAIGGLGGKDAVKRGGTAKSSVNYYVREMERKSKVEKIERERAEQRLRIGNMRREALAGKGGSSDAAGMGGLIGGRFE